MPEEKILERVRRLIAHAEGTPNEGEAANYWAKAQELMARYAIDEAMARNSGKQTVGHAVGRKVNMPGTKAQRTQKAVLLNVICENSRCKLVDCRTHFVVIGMDSDAAFCEALWTSLLLEGWRWMLADMPLREEWISRSVFVSNWLEAFALRVNLRMKEANKRVAASYGSKTGVELALRNTEALVLAKTEELFPKTRATHGGARTRSGAAWVAGTAAGNRADLSAGRNRVSGGSSEAEGPSTKGLSKLLP